MSALPSRLAREMATIDVGTAVRVTWAAAWVLAGTARGHRLRTCSLWSDGLVHNGLCSCAWTSPDRPSLRMVEADHAEHLRRLAEEAAQ